MSDLDLQQNDPLNRPPSLSDYDLFATDRALSDALQREGGSAWRDEVRAFGAACGSEPMIEAGDLANRHTPVLHTHDRFGKRIDQVEYHPSWHQLMQHVFGSGMHSIGWREDRTGGHVAHAAMVFMMAQIETGVCCPAAMTYAVVPSLRAEPELAKKWLPGILANDYDPSPAAPSAKRALTFGMAMTEKQGGSDVRANLTLAAPAGDDTYLLNGHKWFCSAPMSDAFLTLAQAPGGLTCFLVPRTLADGTRNAFRIQRLKDKCGNRSNASSEIEYHDSVAHRVGDEGAGVRTIIEMVHHTRLDASLAPAGIMRQALVQAIHHARYRSAFQKKLVQQPLMQQVLADMALEVEAATLMVMRVARSFDEAASSETAAAFSRIATALSKFWINKRTPNLVYEAMECLGGGGYVEESILSRLYREAPLNSIWEGSGNVIALDILRALQRQPETRDALLEELKLAAGQHTLYDTALSGVDKTLTGSLAESQGRALAQRLSLLLQTSLMLRHAGNRGTTFTDARLSETGHAVYGTTHFTDAVDIIDHAFAPDAC